MGVAAIAVVAAGYRSMTGGSVVVPPPPALGVAAADVPAMIRPCPVGQNCLTTTTVPDGLVHSARADFPSMIVIAQGSGFDAAIPEVDVEQVVGRLPDGTIVILTQTRVPRSAPEPVGPGQVGVPGGVMVSDGRHHWTLTAQLLPDRSASPKPIWLAAARAWTRTAPLPR